MTQLQEVQGQANPEELGKSIMANLHQQELDLPRFVADVRAMDEMGFIPEGSKASQYLHKLGEREDIYTGVMSQIHEAVERHTGQKDPMAFSDVQNLLGVAKAVGMWDVHPENLRFLNQVKDFFREKELAEPVTPAEPAVETTAVPVIGKEDAGPASIEPKEEMEVFEGASRPYVEEELKETEPEVTKAVSAEEISKIPLEEIQSGEQLRQSGFDLRSATKIGQGISGGVFKINWKTAEGREIPAAVKYFQDRQGSTKGDYAPEKEALIRLRGIPGVVQILAFGEATKIGLSAPIIVEEWVEAENFKDNFELLNEAFPVNGKPEPSINKALEQKARWLLSYLETMQELHHREVILNDFKFDHILWDSKAGRVKLIDFGNAVLLGSVWDRGIKSPMADIVPAVEFLFASTLEGNTAGIQLHEELGTTKFRNLGYEMVTSKSFIEAFEEECQKQKAIPEFLKILQRYKNISDTRKDGEGPSNIRALIGELKDYFAAIGLNTRERTTSGEIAPSAMTAGETHRGEPTEEERKALFQIALNEADEFDEEERRVK